MPAQDKQEEIAFFDSVGGSEGYNVFHPVSTARIVDCFFELADVDEEGLVADLGCGSGVFTDQIRKQGRQCVGLDISQGLLRTGRKRFPGIPFVAGDIESLPFGDASLDAVLLSGIVHHLPDPSTCAREVFRVLRPGGSFVAFDPNRYNPAMYLYRDRSSPFYSSKGVTKNERPVVAAEVSGVFAEAGFKVGTEYLSGLSYQYVESGLARLTLPIYNLFDRIVFAPGFMRRLRAFVFTYGKK